MRTKKYILWSIIGVLFAVSLTGLTSCNNLMDKKGTEPTILALFYTDNDAPNYYEDWDDCPNRNSSIVLGRDYALILDFTDPDLDVQTLYTSLNPSFPAERTYRYSINQTYEYQQSCFRGDSWSGKTGNVVLYAYLEDSKGNKSSTVSVSLYFNN